ncbi:MAG: hypothetical protein ACRCZS_01610 [Chroococcidiopsis sp.]
MQLDLSSFVNPLDSCDVVLTAGSKILLAKLDDCANTPTEYRLQVGNTVQPVNATALSIGISHVNGVATSSANDKMVLRKGQIVAFNFASLTNVVINENIEVNAAANVVVKVQPLTAASTSAAASVDIYEMFQILSPTDVPVNFSDTVQDTTDGKSNLQSSSTITSTDLQTNFGYRLRCDDEAIHRVALKGQKAARPVFAIYSQGKIDGCSALVVGKCYASNTNLGGAVKDFIKGQMNLLWQSPYATIFRRSDLETEAQAEYDVLTIKAGIPPRLN